MKIFVPFLALILFVGCQNNNNTRTLPAHSQLDYKQGVNPNSLASKAQDRAFERQTEIEISKINAKTQLEVAKINSQKELEVSKIETGAQKEIAKEDIRVKKEIAIKQVDNSIEISKIQAQAKAHEEKINLYIALVFAFIVLIGIILWYLQRRKNIIIQAEHESARLKQELLVKERELQEQKVLKIMDMAIHGQLPQNLQKDLIDSITHPKEESPMIETSVNLSSEDGKKD